MMGKAEIIFVSVSNSNTIFSLRLNYKSDVNAETTFRIEGKKSDSDDKDHFFVKNLCSLDPI